MKSYFIANTIGTAIKTEGEGYVSSRESAAEKSYFATGIITKVVAMAGSALLALFTPVNPMMIIDKIKNSSAKKAEATAATTGED